MPEERGAEWGGLPIVRKLGDLHNRTRVEVTAQIIAAGQSRIFGVRAFICQIDDGTGQISLAFTGRATIPGLSVGTRCRVEGTAQERDGRLIILNPGYEIEASL